jgi:hypothetical protein
LIRAAFAARPLAALAVALLTGCSSQVGTPSASPSPIATPTSQPSAAAVSPATASSLSPAPVASVCRNPSEHVYHPYRLQLHNPCMTVTGTVFAVRTEPDGDYHILLKLDPQFANLINSANVSGEHGDLVLEPVCELPVTQQDAIASCAGVSPTIARPAVDSHVSATGAYVLDVDHGWMELHPLWEIHAIG